jgi:DNA repair protein RAD57
MLAVQLPHPHGLSKSAIYVSTEAALSTARLSQILKTHPFLCSLAPDIVAPSLSRIHSIQTPDLESQDQILRYQVPVAIERYNVGLVIIDSIAANFRAELHEDAQTPGSHAQRSGNGTSNAMGMAERRSQLVSIGTHLRRLAIDKGIAIVVANQVADRFVPEIQQFHYSQSVSNTPATPQMADPAGAPSTPLRAAPLLTTLDHQQRFFTGWGDFSDLDGDSFLSNASKWKTPSLGLVWANQIAGRIALIREPLNMGNFALEMQTPNRDSEEREGVERRRRFMRVAFASWTASTSSVENGTQYEITGEGVRGVIKQP